MLHCTSLHPAHHALDALNALPQLIPLGAKRQAHKLLAGAESVVAAKEPLWSTIKNENNANKK